MSPDALARARRTSDRRFRLIVSVLVVLFVVVGVFSIGVLNYTHSTHQALCAEISYFESQAHDEGKKAHPDFVRIHRLTRLADTLRSAITCGGS